MKKQILIIILGLVLIAPSLFAQEENKDHPILSRFKGSELKKTEFYYFNEFILPFGKIKNKKFEKTKTIEGKITRKLYKPEKGRTIFEIYKNYITALEQINAEILFKGRKPEEIGSDLGRLYFKTNPMMGAVGKNTLPWAFTVVQHSAKAIIVAKISGDNNDFYVCVIIGNGYEPYTVYQLDIIEVKAMDKNMVTALSIKEDLDKNGHATIYGIHFDIGKSEIKPNSTPTIKEIANFLNKNPDRNIYIVGHTDNIGDFSSNMVLSENRAKAILNELITKYNVNRNQLKAYGVANLSPVKSNITDEGKAKNRRVEIVE